MIVPDRKLGDQQRYYNSSCGDHGCMYKISWQSMEYSCSNKYLNIYDMDWHKQIANPYRVKKNHAVPVMEPILLKLYFSTE